MEQPLSRISQSDLLQMRRAMGLSLGLGFVMLGVKLYGFTLTDSTAILSDAAESVVHVFAVSFAAYSLRLSQKPADSTHMYGHDRISFFSAGFEGAMIVIAALYIVYEAVSELVTGVHVINLGVGTAFTVAAMGINGMLGLYLLRLGKKHGSIVLEANGKHVLTDSWTSLGVVIGLLLTMLTGWLPFDPLMAILVALNILWTGSRLMRRSIGGLMDEADPDIDRILRKILEEQTSRYNIQYHHLRHRNAGAKLLVEFHLLFPDTIPIAQAHDQATRIEGEIYRALPLETEVISHLEPTETHDEIHTSVLRSGSDAPPARG